MRELRLASRDESDEMASSKAPKSESTAPTVIATSDSTRHASTASEVVEDVMLRSRPSPSVMGLCETA